MTTPAPPSSVSPAPASPSTGPAAPRYYATGWELLTGWRVTIASTERFTCPGNPTTGAECKTGRPDYLLIYTLNSTGLPGEGQRQHRMACMRHLTTVLRSIYSNSGHDLQAAHVVITPYTGT